MLENVYCPAILMADREKCLIYRALVSGFFHRHAVKSTRFELYPVSISQRRVMQLLLRGVETQAGEKTSAEVRTLLAALVLRSNRRPNIDSLSWEEQN